jgi:signal peptidase I
MLIALHIINLFNFINFGNLGLYSNHNCIIEKQIVQIKGHSMSPLIKNNEKITFYPNFYHKCKKKPKKQDLVAYDYKGDPLLIIKQIKATDQDIIEIQPNGNLKINGQILVNSTNTPYIFTKNEQNLINLYLTNHKIPPNSFLIFGDNLNNSNDSRKFGAIHFNDIRGKFLIK